VEACSEQQAHNVGVSGLDAKHMPCHAMPHRVTTVVQVQQQATGLHILRHRYGLMHSNGPNKPVIVGVSPLIVQRWQAEGTHLAATARIRLTRGRASQEREELEALQVAL
jgi:hypothetical protein